MATVQGGGANPVPASCFFSNLFVPSESGGLQPQEAEEWELSGYLGMSLKSPLTSFFHPQTTIISLPGFFSSSFWMNTIKLHTNRGQRVWGVILLSRLLTVKHRTGTFLITLFLTYIRLVQTKYTSGVQCLRIWYWTVKVYIRPVSPLSILILILFVWFFKLKKAAYKNWSRKTRKH